MLKYCKNFFYDVVARLIGIKVGLLAVVDTFKYMFQDDVRPYMAYLCRYDKEAYSKRFDQIFDNCVDQRLHQEMLKIIDREFERALKRHGRKTKKVR